MTDLNIFYLEKYDNNIVDFHKIYTTKDTFLLITNIESNLYGYIKDNEINMVYSFLKFANSNKIIIDLNKYSYFADTLLCTACSYSQTDIVELIFEYCKQTKYQLDINKKSKRSLYNTINYVTALDCAIYACNTDIINLFIKYYNIDINNTEAITLQKPLFITIFSELRQHDSGFRHNYSNIDNIYNLIKFLIDNKVPVNVKDANNDTPITLAFMDDSLLSPGGRVNMRCEVIKLLIQNGVDVDNYTLARSNYANYIYEKPIIELDPPVYPVYSYNKLESLLNLYTYSNWYTDHDFYRDESHFDLAYRHEYYQKTNIILEHLIKNNITIDIKNIIMIIVNSDVLYKNNNFMDTILKAIDITFKNTINCTKLTNCRRLIFRRFLISGLMYSDTNIFNSILNKTTFDELCTFIKIDINQITPTNNHFLENLKNICEKYINETLIKANNNEEIYLITNKLIEYLLYIKQYKLIKDVFINNIQLLINDNIIKTLINDKESNKEIIKEIYNKCIKINHKIGILCLVNLIAQYV